MIKKRFKQPCPFGEKIIELEGNELRVKRSSDLWTIRFELTDELRQFLKEL